MQITQTTMRSCLNSFPPECVLSGKMQWGKHTRSPQACKCEAVKGADALLHSEAACAHLWLFSSRSDSVTLPLIASVLNLAHAVRNSFDWGNKNLKNTLCLPGNSTIAFFFFTLYLPIYHLGINELFHMSQLSIKRNCGKSFGDGGDCSLQKW